MLQHHRIPITRTARFSSLGDKSADIKEVWFVLHGYGQLASDFISEFEAIQEPNRFIVAPEALSRFYTRRAPNKVGASWMTREGREHEINDYLGYLNQVALFVYDMLGKRPQTTVLGFSQGATTASRWVTLGRLPVSRLILWGGDIAQDLNMDEFATHLSHAKPMFVVGNDDTYLTADRVEAEERRMKAHNIPYELVTFDGGHVIDPHVLRTIA